MNAATYGVAIETMELECHARGQALVQLGAEMTDTTIFLGTEGNEIDPFADYVQALVPSGVALVPA